ncbi:unnamed protein product [Vitrella brassicaformis CCMP3155]|uniref:Uncharacterized protein n=1 Tax=Vitrella brassicaformis (strain CCMP3155) TaxID=1169540 RepID=A0A0G4G7G6_VITBC|nr:unnamed protein product [Vitrella brassicaformis CCMP3155]|eukprot:CEM24632.1 unnamed protein product [Vitrella brassicaformis CCMP3155]
MVAEVAFAETSARNGVWEQTVPKQWRPPKGSKDGDASYWDVYPAVYLETLRAMLNVIHLDPTISDYIMKQTTSKAATRRLLKENLLKQAGLPSHHSDEELKKLTYKDAMDPAERPLDKEPSMYDILEEYSSLADDFAAKGSWMSCQKPMSTNMIRELMVGVNCNYEWFIREEPEAQVVLAGHSHAMYLRSFARH